MTINDYRTKYRNLMETAKSYGWTAAQFNERCATLADWFISRGESKAKAFCSAATEVVQEEIQEAAAA